MHNECTSGPPYSSPFSPLYSLWCQPLHKDWHPDYLSSLCRWPALHLFEVELIPAQSGTRYGMHNFLNFGGRGSVVSHFKLCGVWQRILALHLQRFYKSFRRYLKTKDIVYSFSCWKAQKYVDILS